MKGPLAEGFLQWATQRFDAALVRDVIAPTVADLRYEHARARSDDERRRIARRGTIALWQSAAAAFGLGLRRRWDQSSMWLLLVPAAIMLVAARALEPLRPERAAQHLWFGAGGIALALLIAAWPMKPGDRSVKLSAAGIAAALVLVTFFGERFGDARRWLALGPVTVHVAALLTPLFAWVMLRWQRDAPRHRLAFVTICGAALALQPNLPMCVLWGAIAVALTPRGRARELTFVACGASFALSVIQAPQLSSLIHESAMPILVGSYNPAWATITLVGLFVPALVAWRSQLPAFALLFAVWPLLAYFDEGLVLLSYGGSMLVAYLGCVGLLLRSRRDAVLAV